LSSDNAQSSFKSADGGTCKIMTSPKTRGAGAATLFKAMTDKEAKPGKDGAICLQFTNFQMGEP